MDPNYKDKFKVGDIVTAYRSGYWRIIDIGKWRNRKGDMIVNDNYCILELVMSVRGKKPKKIARQCGCNLGYLKKLTKKTVADNKQAAIKLWDKVAEIAMEDN